MNRDVKDELDVFVSRQNITRYRRLADATTTSSERIRLFELLKRENAKLRNGPRSLNDQFSEIGRVP